MRKPLIVEVARTQCHYLACSDKTQEVPSYKSTTIYWKDASTISPSDFVFTPPKDAIEAFIE